ERSIEKTRRKGAQTGRRFKTAVWILLHHVIPKSLQREELHVILLERVPRPVSHCRENREAVIPRLQRTVRDPHRKVQAGSIGRSSRQRVHLIVRRIEKPIRARR